MKCTLKCRVWLAVLFFQLQSVIGAHKPLTSGFPTSLDLLTATIQDLSSALSDGTVTSVQLVKEYLARIEHDNHKGHNLHAVIETAPYDLLIEEATKADKLRSHGEVLGHLHGIPILIKDNIGTIYSLGMNTTAGSYALLPEYAGKVLKDATIISRLLARGAIILGKTNLSEWSNFKGNITNGWSARGGQTQSPYVLGGPFVAGGDPCGSSSGSCSAVAAGWAPISIGTETDGSLVCPASRHALYSMKPTVGLASRAGIVPISHTQDSPGPIAKSTWDIAVILSAISATTADPCDDATIEASKYAKEDYTKFLTSSFASIQLGVPNHSIFYNASNTGSQQIVDEAYAAIEKMITLGAKFQNVSIPSIDEIIRGGNESIVLQYEFKQDLAAYLSERDSSEYTPSEREKDWFLAQPELGLIRTLADVIIFNDKHRDIEFAENECCQERFIECVQTTGLGSEEYKTALHFNRDILGRQEGLDAVFTKHPELIALVAPSEGFTTAPSAVAGYPIATVPLGYDKETGQPFGLAFIGRQYDEANLIKVMSAFEANFPRRRVPQFKKGKASKHAPRPYYPDAKDEL